MSQIQTKFIADLAITTAKINALAVTTAKIADANVTTAKIAADNVDDTLIRLRNNNFMRARNNAGSADVNIVKVNASDVIEFASLPQAPGSASVNNDLVNKGYADATYALASSSTQVFKAGVDVVSTSNLTLSGEQTIDGFTTSASRILVAGQTTGANNGIYVTASGAWTRATDMDSSSEVFMGQEVYVKNGTSNGHSFWVLYTSGPFTLGTTSLKFYKENESKIESLTLNGTDITNQYKDLSFEGAPNSVELFVSGVRQWEGVDYTLSVVANVTRLTFAGDLATGGNAALISGDVLRLMYIIKRNQ